MDQKPQKIFGCKLKALRSRDHLSVQSFAEMCGLSASKIENYMYGRNNPTVPAIISICNAFTVSPNVLLDGLYESPTELDNVEIILNGLSSLSNDVRSRALDLYEPIINGFIDSVPKLEHTNFGTRLRILREDMGMSISRFATICMISDSSLTSIESGQRFPGFGSFLIFCKVLHVSPEYLLSSNLHFTTYFDKRIVLLTPRQILAFAEVIQL